MNHPLLCCVLLLSVLSCSSDAERYEDVEKLRAIGVLSDPVVAAPSTTAAPSTIKLTVYAAVPHGDTVTAQPYLDENGPVIVVAPRVQIVAGSDKIETHASLDIYHVDATIAVPAAEALHFGSADNTATLHYGVKLISKSFGEQNVTGNLVIYPAGSPQLAAYANKPTVAITAPVKGASLSGSQDLKATASTANDETLRIGWFVTDGEIKNRNSNETTWDPKKTTGQVTLIVTARGAKTGAFSLDVIDFTAN